MVGVRVIESVARAAREKFFALSHKSKQTRKRGVGANVTNGAPENGVLERYERGRFAVRAFSVSALGNRVVFADFCMEAEV